MKFKITSEEKKLILSMRINDIFNMSSKDFYSLPENKLKWVLKIFASEWQSSEAPTAKAIKLSKKLLPLTIKNGPLTSYRPDKTILYRGGKILNRPQSFSWDKKVARMFGNNITKVKITNKDYALDLDKILGTGESEKEVIIIPRVA